MQPQAHHKGSFFLSPLPNFHRVLVMSCRCVALVKQGISPYSGSICHEAPITVHALVALDSLDEWIPGDRSVGQVRAAPASGLYFIFFALRTEWKRTQ